MLTWRLVRADSRAQGSNLPLHCAAENQASEGVTKLLLAAYTEAAKAEGGPVRACLVGVVVAVVLMGAACGALSRSVGVVGHSRGGRVWRRVW